MSNIVLITDFGLSEYVGQIKGIINKINPQANIIDLTHNISKFNVIEAGYILFNSIEYFDEQSIFLSIVDPGVGTDRLPIIIQTKQNIYIGPNNGLFTLIIDKLEIIRIVNILNPFYLRKIISSTFHGRDIFAPISAHISNGIRITDLGSEINISEAIRLEGFYPSISENQIVGIVIYSDTFGNLITNIHSSLLYNQQVTIHFQNYIINSISNTYIDVAKGEILAYIGSTSYLELAINQGNLSSMVLKYNNRIIIDLLQFK